jgi:hypothetical protein
MLATFLGFAMLKVRLEIHRLPFLSVVTEIRRIIPGKKCEN